MASKALRPDRLTVEPSDSNASKIFKHWMKTFQSYLTSLPEGTDKLGVLVNLVSADIYDLFSEDADYETAVATLTSAYVKTPNPISARHMLATRKQLEGESFDSYLTSLRSLAKDCDFKQVTAAVYQQESIRDSFISGTRSQTVRQRLLEQKDLNLDTMIDIARSLESAEIQSESFNSSTPPHSAAIKKSTAFKSEDKNCWNCGKPKHPKSACKAKDEVCNYCKRIGHFEKYCRSKNKKSVASVDTKEDAESSPDFA